MKKKITANKQINKTESEHARRGKKTDKNVNKLIRDRQMTCAFNGHIGSCT